MDHEYIVQRGKPGQGMDALPGLGLIAGGHHLDNQHRIDERAVGGTRLANDGNVGCTRVHAPAHGRNDRCFRSSTAGTFAGPQMIVDGRHDIGLDHGVRRTGRRHCSDNAFHEFEFADMAATIPLEKFRDGHCFDMTQSSIARHE